MRDHDLFEELPMTEKREFETPEQPSTSEPSPAGSQESDPTPPSNKSRKEFDIDIFKGWCKSCGICAAFCPRECIELDEEGNPHVKDDHRCTGCGWCELHCPDFAISVRPRRKEISPEGGE